MIARRPVRVLLALIVLSAAIPAGLHVFGIARGLRAEYFDTTDRSGDPHFTKIDANVSAEQLTASWLGDPPGSFSARWFGYLLVDHTGPYTIGTRSDDGSWLTIDGTRSVDNGGHHAAVTRSATVTLERGEHPILLEYTQDVADYDIALLWGDSERSLAPVPAWRLSPSRLAPWKLGLAHALDWLSALALILAVLYAGWLAATTARAAIVHVIGARPKTAALLFFIALTIVETWPLAAHPARLSRNDNGDTVQNEWTIAWVAHEAPRDPLHLFDANILFPERDTLAYSESMIVPSAMAAPALWAGASPVLAYNLVLLAGFVLSGWAMSIVMARWTASWSAGLLSGILFGINAHTLTRLPHLQAQHVEFIPLALFALDELLRRPGARKAAWLALWFTLEALTSVYLLVITAVALAVSAVVRPEDWSGRVFRRAALWIAAAAALSAVALAPFLVPYWRVSRLPGMTRSVDDAIGFAASWSDYLSTPGRWHYDTWSHNYFTATALFPGALGLALSLVALVTGVAFTNRRARMCVAFGIAGVALSFGGKLPGYLLLFRYVPLFQSIRAVNRFGFLGITAVAMLAGFGLVELLKRMPGRFHLAATALALGIAAFEPYCAPIWFARFEGISPIYSSLKDEPHAIVAELPFWSTAASFRHAAYMLNSTTHWKPMLNGYAGFQPPSFERNVAALAGFPDAASMAALRAQGVTDIFVHGDQTGLSVLKVLDQDPSLTRVAADHSLVRYQLHDPPAR